MSFQFFNFKMMGTLFETFLNKFYFPRFHIKLSWQLVVSKHEDYYNMRIHRTSWFTFVNTNTVNNTKLYTNTVNNIELHTNTVNKIKLHTNTVNNTELNIYTANNKKNIHKDLFLKANFQFNSVPTKRCVVYNNLFIKIKKKFYLSATLLIPFNSWSTFANSVFFKWSCADASCSSWSFTKIDVWLARAPIFK